MATNSVWGSWISIRKRLKLSSVLQVRVGMDGVSMTCFHFMGFLSYLGKRNWALPGVWPECYKWLGGCTSENYVENMCEREKPLLMGSAGQEYWDRGGEELLQLLIQILEEQRGFWLAVRHSNTDHAFHVDFLTSHGNSKPPLVKSCLKGGKAVFPGKERAQCFQDDWDI